MRTKVQLLMTGKAVVQTIMEKMNVQIGSAIVYVGLKYIMVAEIQTPRDRHKSPIAWIKAASTFMLYMLTTLVLSSSSSLFSLSFSGSSSISSSSA